MAIARLINSVYDYLQASYMGWLSKFVVAVVVLFVGFILGKLAGRLVYKFLHSFDINENLKKLTGVKVQVEEILEIFTTYFIYFITIVTVLQQVGIATTILHMIAAGVLIIIILSTFLGIKDFIPNAIAGFFVQKKKLVRIGETIKVKGMQGKIVGISLVETKMETKQGDIIFIPNSVLTKTEVVKVKLGKNKK